MLTGENGIIKQSQEAKKETEIANEKEIIEKATVQTIANDTYGNLEIDRLQDELDKETGEGKTETTETGEIIKVVFIESQRNYGVDLDGNVRELTWW